MSVKTIFAATALAASSLVNAAVIPVRQVAGSEQTCVDQNPGHKYVTRLASNVQYEVICGADYYGSDLADGIKWPGSFEGCLAACDANTECKAISWANGPCYLKGGVPTLTTGNDAVWTAMKNPAPSCEGEVTSNGASYITSAGNFEIMCQQDYAGGDLPYNTRVNSFAECIDYCAADEKCIDVSYEYGACYPKKELGNLVPKGSVWTAKLTVPRAGASPSPSPVASEATSSPTPTPEVAKALTCDPNSNNNPTAYKNFAVQCFYDHAGADMGAYPETTTFESCMDACEANGECVAVSWVYGTCWMKNAANPGPSDVGHVWGAARPARVVSSSVVVEPSVTPSVSASADAQITPSVSASVDAQITPSAGSESSVVSSATITPAADSTPSPADSSSATPTPSELSTLVTVSLINPTPAPAPTDV